MSRIFDSLRKAGGKAAQSALPAIARAAVPSQAPSSEAVAQGVPGTAVVRAARDVVRSTEPKIRGVHLRVPEGAPVLPFDGVHPKAAEQYRIVRTKIVQHPLQPRVLVVASPGAGDGKTVSSINIAGALALKGEVRVLLVDGDFRRSSCSKQLRIPNAPGLTDVLSHSCSLEEAIVRVEDFPNLYVLPAGTPRANPSELLESSYCASIVQALRQQFRYTVFDGPPVGAVADSDILQAFCDGVLIVMRPDHTQRSLGLQALELIPKEKLVGVVVNHVEPWMMWKPREYYYQYYNRVDTPGEP